MLVIGSIMFRSQWTYCPLLVGRVFQFHFISFCFIHMGGLSSLYVPYMTLIQLIRKYCTLK